MSLLCFARFNDIVVSTFVVLLVAMRVAKYAAMCVSKCIVMLIVMRGDMDVARRVATRNTVYYGRHYACCYARYYTRC